MKLSDTFLRALRPTGQVQKKSDGGGLYIHVSPTGGKLWRMAYSFGGKQKTLSFGPYMAPPWSQEKLLWYGSDANIYSASASVGSALMGYTRFRSSSLCRRCNALGYIRFSESRSDRFPITFFLATSGEMIHTSDWRAACERFT